MSYERFKSPLTPATLANPATLYASNPQSVAGIATVAGVHRENHDFKVLTVANVARFRQPSTKTVASVASLGTRKITDPTDPADLQIDTSRCFVCNEPEDPDRLFVAVLTRVPGRHHWIHHDCHAEHSRRCVAKRESVHD